MYNPYGEEPRLNKFILISVILHVIMFFTLPHLDSFLESDIPGMAGGGVIQVMQVQTSVTPPRPSPITDPTSQTTVPRPTDPKPVSDLEPVEKAVAQPSEMETSEPETVDTEPITPEIPVEQLLEEKPTEPEQLDEMPEHIEESDGVLTSPVGPEVVVDTEHREAVTPPTEPKPQPEASKVESGGSGQGIVGSDDESGISESGQGEAEIAPPAPAPPPSGTSLFAGGGIPGYPKDAMHGELEGMVTLILDVAANGDLMIIEFGESSGYAVLDSYAENYIKAQGTFPPQEYDYRMTVTVIFEKDGFVTRVETWDEVQWLNAP